MEHRLSERFAASYPVDILQDPRHILKARICNLSRHGALLEADDAPLPRCGHIQLELSPAGSSMQRLRSVVIHRDDHKLGVMFLDEWSPENWETLARSVRNNPSHVTAGATAVADAA